MKHTYIYGLALAVSITLLVGPALADRTAGEIKNAIDKISTASQTPPAGGNNCDGMSLLSVCSGYARPQSGPTPAPSVNAPQGLPGKANSPGAAR